LFRPAWTVRFGRGNSIRRRYGDMETRKTPFRAAASSPTELMVQRRPTCSGLRSTSDTTRRRRPRTPFDRKSWGARSAHFEEVRALEDRRVLRTPGLFRRSVPQKKKQNSGRLSVHCAGPPRWNARRSRSGHVPSAGELRNGVGPANVGCSRWPGECPRRLRQSAEGKSGAESVVFSGNRGRPPYPAPPMRSGLELEQENPFAAAPAASNAHLRRAGVGRSPGEDFAVPPCRQAVWKAMDSNDRAGKVEQPGGSQAR